VKPECSPLFDKHGEPYLIERHKRGLQRNSAENEESGGAGGHTELSAWNQRHERMQRKRQSWRWKVRKFEGHIEKTKGATIVDECKALSVFLTPNTSTSSKPTLKSCTQSMC
jgi:hypothetical protein